MNPFAKIKIIEYRNGKFSEKTDSVASERKLKILSNNKEILSLLCTPTMVKELVVGFALSEGLIRYEESKDPQSMSADRQAWCPERIEVFWKDDEIEVNLPVVVPEAVATLTSGCAKGVTFVSGQKIQPLQNNLRINCNLIFELYKEFQRKSDIFKETGGVHSAALYSENEIIVFAEDIGRHNAADKIIGYAFLENISVNDKMLLLSGRLSSEITTKAIKAGVPVIVSRAAPTDMAVEIAKKHNLTLIGFLRGQRLNIYSGSERINRDK